MVKNKPLLITIIALSILFAAGLGYTAYVMVEARTTAVIRNLPESSAIKQASAPRDKAEEAIRKTSGWYEEKHGAVEKADRHASKLEILYGQYSASDTDMMRISGTAGAGEKLFPFFLKRGTRDDRYFPAMQKKYPECTIGGNVVELYCVYAVFILDRVPKNQKLNAALAAAKKARIQTILTVSRFAVEQGTVQINVLASDEEIINFMLKDAGNK